MNRKNIMVFGVGGFVGINLLNEIDESKYNVIRVVHNKEGDAKDINESIVCDICFRDEVGKIIDKYKPDYIINLAGIHSVIIADDNIENTIGVNLLGSVNILDSVCMYSPNTKVLLVGSSEVYAMKSEPLVELDELNPRNIYGYTKLWQEQVAQWYAKKKGISVICTRSFNHIGMYQKDTTVIASFCRQAAEIKLGLKEPVIYTGNLDVVRDFLDVRDVINAYILLLESDVKSGVYNVCSNRGYLLRDILNTILGFVGTEIRIETDSGRVRKGESNSIVGNNKKLIEDVSWKRKYEIEITLKEIYESQLSYLRFSNK